ncbi:MAG: hypothetical protein H6711_04065 [Myxococcales bacterium]|nr:hypothetical protein [Myxococcales bacterium]
MKVSHVCGQPAVSSPDVSTGSQTAGPVVAVVPPVVPELASVVVLTAVAVPVIPSVVPLDDVASLVEPDAPVAELSLPSPTQPPNPTSAKAAIPHPRPHACRDPRLAMNPVSTALASSPDPYHARRLTGLPALSSARARSRERPRPRPYPGGLSGAQVDTPAPTTKIGAF